MWRKPREAMLQAQYAVAIDLYKHEDTTNWHKLNNFFYITAGLAAALGFTLGKEGRPTRSMEEISQSLAMVICVIGLGSALAFSQMLRYGRRYLGARKRAAMELEEYMAWHGGQRIVGRETQVDGNAWLKQSPTGLIMMLLPVLVALCWAAMIGVLIVN
ncbi:hypothetical protein ACFQ0Q_28110 [Streptomyces aureus]